MAKWIREWFVLSVFMMSSFAMALLFWTLWPWLVNYLATAQVSLDLEALIVITMLLVVVVGYLKLVFGNR